MTQSKISRVVVRYLFAITLVTAVSLLMVLGVRQLNIFKKAAPAFRTKGSASAKIKIEEFTDFQCPACRVAYMIMKEAEKAYGPALSVSLKHYPLPMHRWAITAAVNAECAGRQDRFWPYADMLFERQDAWKGSSDAQSVFSGYASELGLNVPDFDACVKDGGALGAVRADEEESLLRGIDSTPTFFVNGKKYAGARQLLQAFTDYDNKK